MAADNEVRLISKIVHTGDITEAAARGVTVDWFTDPECRAVYRFVEQVFAGYGNVPSGYEVKKNYPTFRLLNVSDPVEYLLDAIQSARRSADTYTLLTRAVDTFRDPSKFEEVIDLLRKGVGDLDVAVQASSDIDLSHDPSGRFSEYERLRDSGGGLLGLPTGFPTIDKATSGLQNGQLVTIIAPPKSGKSQLALKIASNVHLLGKHPMYQSFEMSNKEQQERFDALRAGISHARLRRGTLTPAEEERYRAALASMVGSPPFLLTDSLEGTTVSSLAAKVSAANPDVVFVDGVYLMMDEVTGEANTPQALTNITRGLKRLAQRLDRPVVVTTQTLLWKMRGNAINQNSIGYSSSFLQDSDVVVGLERTEAEAERNLKIVASRNCGPAEVVLDWDWEAGRFQEFGGSGPSGDDDDDDDDEDDYSDTYAEALGA